MRERRDPRHEAWALATLVTTAIVWLGDLAVLRAGAPDPLDDSWEYGAVARALLAGHGFRTLVIHPPLWTLRDAADTVPVLVHGPLLPVLLAPLLALFGPHVLDGIAILAALFAFAAAIATFRLGARLLSPAVGAAAALLFTLSPLTLRAVHHDVALPLGALLLVLALDQTLRTRPHGVRAGLLLGLGALVRPEFLLAAPVLAWRARASWRRFVVALLVVIAPWGWHGIANTGSPFFNLSSYLVIGYWGAHPGIGILRDFDLPPHAYRAALLRAFPSLLAKWFDFAPHAVKALLLAPSALTGLFVPIGAAGAWQAPRSRDFATTAAALALIPLAILTLTLYDPRYLVPFLPLLALGAAQGAREAAVVLPRALRGERVWFGALVALLLVSSVPALRDGRSEGLAARARLQQERAALLATPAPAGRIAFSDTPDFVAWTTGHPTVWVTEAEYRTLPRAGAAPTAVARPVVSGGELTWFHDAEGRGAAHAAHADSLAR